jgi:hypothetical protein
MNGKHIKTLVDIAKLSNEEFNRFLPDFFAWFNAAKLVMSAYPDKKASDMLAGLVWVDDDRAGVIDGFICESELE